MPISSKTKQQRFTLILVLALGLTTSSAIQYYYSKTLSDQKRHEFESEISSISLLIIDSFSNIQNNSKKDADFLAHYLALSHKPQTLDQLAPAFKDISAIFLSDAGQLNRLTTQNHVISAEQQDKLYQEYTAQAIGKRKTSYIIKSRNKPLAACSFYPIPQFSTHIALSCFNLKPLLDDIAYRSSSDELDIHIYDGSFQQYRHLYSYFSHTQRSATTELDQLQSKQSIFLPGAIPFGDKNLSILFSPSVAAYRQYRAIDFLPLALGIILTLITAAYIRSQHLRNQFIAEQVNSKTKDLTEAKIQLEMEIIKANELYLELDRSNQELSTLTNNIDCILWQGDPDSMRFTYISDQVSKILGHRSGEYLNGKRLISDFKDSHSGISVSEVISQASKTSQSIRLVYQTENAWGQKVWFNSVISLVYEQEKLVKLRGVLIDITQQKRQEAKNKEIQSELNQAQKLKSIGQLAAGIAHEINTPVQFIGNNLNFIEETCNDLIDFIQTCLSTEFNQDEAATKLAEIDFDYIRTELPDAVSQSESGVSRISEIVKAMKQFSHPGGIDKQDIDLNQAISSTITIAQNEWKYFAELTTDFDPELPPLSCYPGELNQAILNIIVNAAHAIEEKDMAGEKGKIHISTQKGEASIIICIEDNGCGIDEKIMDQIFDPFFTTKEVGKGSGQGLAITYSVIKDKHHGDIQIHSEKNVGTTITIELPNRM